MCTVVGIRALKRKKKKVKVEFDLEEGSEDSVEGENKQKKNISRDSEKLNR